MFYKRKIGNSIDGLAKYFERLALGVDQVGNVAFKDLFDDTLLKKGISFGDEDKAISEVLGWNEKFFELSKAGKILVKILDWIDPDHCQKTLIQAIQKSEDKLKLYKKLQNERKGSI